MSFLRAAEELHISVPAVSQQIKEMEEDMGVSLFSRENRKIELTAVGEYFLIYARRISSTLKEASTILLIFSLKYNFYVHPSLNYNCRLKNLRSCLKHSREGLDAKRTERRNQGIQVVHEDSEHRTAQQTPL
jgi:predicted transcriptional regulator